MQSPASAAAAAAGVPAQQQQTMRRAACGSRPFVAGAMLGPKLRLPHQQPQQPPQQQQQMACRHQRAPPLGLCRASSQQQSVYTPREQAYRQRMGDRGYERFEALKKGERQRVWDNMRALAAERYRQGVMPPWFKREWLDIEEAPTNTWWRQQGLSAYRSDASWLGESAPSTSSGSGGPGGDGGSARSGGGGGGGWWRPDDPYWPLRDWGDHPMRWWTWGLAGLLAAGGVWVHARTGCASAVQLGFGAAAVLGMAAVAMSDMRNSELGELGVKAAWATCVLLAASDFTMRGLAPQPQPDAEQPWLSASRGTHAQHASSRGTGWVCFTMAVLYMWTGMSGLGRYALPTNPGEAFKMVDVAERHKVWAYWGYSGLTMRV